MRTRREAPTPGPFGGNRAMFTLIAVAVLMIAEAVNHHARS
jgi:hypothetical protein